jgi:hypothetical protein
VRKSRVLNQHRRAFASSVVLSLAIVAHLHAQDVTPSSTIGRALKSTVLDPTTYAASALYYDAAIRDWKASQPFFRHGFVEQNSRFTISGFSGATLHVTPSLLRVVPDAAAVSQMDHACPSPRR